MDFAEPGFCETRAAVAAEAIKWSTFIFVIIFGRFQLIIANRPPSELKLHWTLLDLTHAFLALVSAALASLSGYSMINHRWTLKYLEITLLRKISAEFAMAACLILLLGISCYRHWMRLNPHGFVCGLLGMLATARITETASLYERLYNAEAGVFILRTIIFIRIMFFLFYLTMSVCSLMHFLRC